MLITVTLSGAMSVSSRPVSLQTLSRIFLFDVIIYRNPALPVTWKRPKSLAQPHEGQIAAFPGYRHAGFR